MITFHKFPADRLGVDRVLKRLAIPAISAVPVTNRKVNLRRLRLELVQERPKVKGQFKQAEANRKGLNAGSFLAPSRSGLLLGE